MKTRTLKTTSQSSMKNVRHARRRPSILTTSVAALLGVSLLAGSALAAPDAWNGVTNPNWDTVTNWSLGAKPTLGDAALFGQVAPASGATITVGANETVQLLSFNAPAGGVTNSNWTLTGGNIVLQGGQGGGGDIILNAQTTTTISSGLSSVGLNSITIVSNFAGTPQNAILNLTGTNNFGGAVNVNSGTVNLNGGLETTITGTIFNIGNAGGAAGTAVVNDSGGKIANNVAVAIGAAGVLNISGGDDLGSFSGVAGAQIVLSGTGAFSQQDNSNQTYAGTITGTGINVAGAIIKSGTGTLTLSGANNYTNFTTVGSGVLNIQNSSALGVADGTAGNGTKVFAGATLQLQGGISVGNEALTLVGTGAAGQSGALVNVSGTNTFGGALTLTGATTIASNAGTLNLTNTTAVAGAFALTLNTATDTGGGSLSGSINAQTSLTVNGNGSTWTLNGNNSAFAGPITVNNAATLKAGVANAFGNGNVAVTLNNTATLDVNGTTQTIDTLNGVAGTALLNGIAAATGTLIVGNNNGSSTFSGLISDIAATPGATGALNLTKNGTGTFTIGGTVVNGYEGVTRVNAGTLLVTNTSALFGNFAALGSATNVVADGTVVASGATLAFGGGVNIGNEFLTLVGTGTGGTAGALNNVAGTNTANSLISLTGATTINSTIGNLLLNNIGAVQGGGALTLAGAGNGTIANGLTAPVVISLTKNGNGTWTIGAAGTSNTYTGATTVNAGILQAGVVNAFGVNSAVNLTTGGATLDLNGKANAIGSLNGAAGTIVTNGNAAAVATLTTGSLGNALDSFAGIITDTGTAAGALSLNKVGAGTQVLSGANNYGGTTTVTAGALNIQNSTALGAATGAAATGTTVLAGATLQLQGGIGVGNEALTLNGAGTGAGNQNGALVNVAGANTWGGALTLAGSTTIANNAAAGAANLLTLSNTAGIVNGGAGPFTLTLNTATSTGDGVLAAGLTNVAVNVLTVNGTGSTWTLTGNNTAWTGNTINVNNSATLKAGTGSTNAFGIGSIINLPGVATLDLNGTTAIVAQLNATAVTETVTNTNTTTPANMTIGTGAGGVALNAVGTTYVGTITQGGAGTQPLSLTIAGNGGAAGAASTVYTLGGVGTNTYSGLTTINAAQTLIVTNVGPTSLGTSIGAADGTLVTGTGMLQLNTATPAVPGVTIGNETLLLNGAGTGISTGIGGVGNASPAGGTGALFSAGGNNAANGSIQLQGASTITVGAGTLTVGTAGTANFVTSVGGGTFGLTLNNSTAAGSAVSTFNDIITGGVSGVAGLTVNSLAANTGTWVLAGANTYTGPTLIANGTAKAGVASAGPAAAPTSGAFGINSATTVNTPGKLDINGSPTVLGSLAGTGTVDNSSLINATLTTGTVGSTTFTGNIINTAGTLNLTKIGAGTTFTLTGNNTYTGLTTVAQGALVAGSQNALGAGSIAPSGIGGAPGVMVNAGASLVLGTATVGQAAAGGGIAGPLTITLNGNGAAGLGLNGALTASLNSTYNGSIFVATNSTISSGGFTLNLGGAAATPAQVINKNGVNLTLTGGGTINVNATITGAAANSDLIVNGTTANLNVANNYNGATVITSANNVFPNAAGAGNGIVNANVANALPTANGRSAIRMDGSGTGGSTLNLAGGFNQSVASLSSLAGANSTINLNAQTLTIGFGTGVDLAGDAAANFAGVIAGAGGITKDETSTQILSGINTYTGTTTVNGGTLKAGVNQAVLGGAFGNNSAVVINNAGILDLNGNNVTIGSLNSTSALAVVNDSMGPGTLTIGNGTATALGTYIGTFGAGPLSLVINGSAGGMFTIGGTQTNTYTGTTTVNTGNTLIVTDTGLNPLGAVGTVASGTTVAAGATLQLATGGVTIGNEFLTISGNGAAGQGGALNNQSGVNNFGGPITLAAASTINVTAGTLNLNGAGNLTSGGGVFPLTLNAAGGALGTSTLVIDSGISTVNKTGAGTWRLIGASTYTGATNVTGGTLQAGVATVGGAAPVSGAFGINSVVTVTAPGILDLNGNSNTIGSLTGTGTVDNTSAPGAVLTTGTAGSTAFTGNIINTGAPLGLTKVGAATVFTLGGVNSYSGLTTVAQGMLVANSANALGSGSVAPSATGVAPGITVATGASLELTFAGTVTGTTGPLTLTINGTGTALNGIAAANTGALVAGAATTFDGSIFVASNSTISANGFTLTLGTIAQPTEFLNKNGVNLTLNGGGGAGKIIVNEAITGAAANSDLIVTNGATDLNVANSYNGITFVDNRGGANGVLNTGVANALPTANGRTTMKIDSVGGGASTLNIAGTALNPAGANQSIASLEGIATSKVTLGNNILTIGFGLAALDINGTANANFAGIISGGAGTGGITKDENSTQIFSGLNTYSGPTTVVNGKLKAGVGQAGAAGAFGTNSNVTVGSAATVAGGTAPVLELAGFNETIGSLSGLAAAGGFVQNNFGAVGTTATLTLGSGGGSGNFGGVLRNAPTVGAVGAGTLAIVKIGTGTQTFSGINTYTGTTTVNAGTLQAGSLQAFGVNSVMTVTAPGILELANFSNTVDSLFGNGTVQNTLANGPGATALTLSGAMGNAGVFTGLIKDTAGTPLLLVLNDVNGLGASETLSGQSTWVGGTTLNAGRLNINASSIPLAAPVANPVLSGPLGTGLLTINGGIIGTTTGTGANNAVGNAVQVNANFAVAGPFTFDGVDFAGPVRLNQAGATVITTNSGFLDFSGTIGDAFGPGGGLTLVGGTSLIGSSTIGGVPAILGQVDASNTYAGLTTITGGALVFLAKNSGAVAIPGNLQIDAGSTVRLDSFAPNVAGLGTTANQIATTSNVLVNGALDLSGIKQAINGLTGTGTIQLNDANGANVGGASVFTVNAGNFGGSIFDNGKGGQLVKTSPGTLVLTGFSPYVGNTTINAGTLQVDGFIGSKNTIVNIGGALTGIGILGGNVLNGGIVSPGHSPGTLTVKGNYTQTPAGTLIIEVAGKAAAEHDLLAVGGAANLDGGLRLIQLGGFKLKVGDKIIFLTAAGGVNGKFASVSNPFSTTGTIVTTGVVYHSDYVALEAQQGSFAAFANSHGCGPNGEAVAKALDSVAFGSQSSKNSKLINFLNGEPLGNLCSDFDKIAPEELASIFNIGISLANVQSMNLLRRMEDIQAGAAGFSASGYAMNAGGGPSYSGELAANTGRTANGVAGPEGKGGKEMRAPQEDTRLGVFVTGVGEFTNIGNTANARGYDLTTGGFTLGVDYKVTPNFAIGINAGYARTGANLNNNGRVTVDGAKLGLYATYFTGTGFYVDAAVSGGYNSYDTRRSALKGFATGSTKGGEFNALFATGYDWKTGGLRIGPTANVQYTNVGIDSFREHGSLAPLNITNKSGESLRTALGIKASYDWQVGGVVIRPEVRAAWQHEFGDSSFALDSRFANGAGNTFTVRGPAIGDDSLLLGAGMAVLWNERTSTYVYYDGELLRNNYSSNNVSGGVRLSF